MAIRFKIDGMDVECDAPLEAASLLAALKTQQILSANGAVKHNEAPPEKAVTGATFKDFWNATDDSGRRMLKAVAEALPEPVTAEALARELQLKDVNAVAWVRRKLNATAIENGVRLGRLISLGKVHVEGRPKTSYTATGRLIEALKLVPA